MTTHKRMVGDTLKPLNAVIKVQGGPLDLSSYTVKFQMENDAGTVVIAETTTGVTAHPTQTFTAVTAGQATCNNHGLKKGDQVIVATSGTLPSGLAASTRYFAVNVTPNKFELASVPGGTTVIAGAGTGTHTFYVVGSVQYSFLSAAVTTAGTNRAWFTVYSGTDRSTAPVTQYGIAVELVAFGN